MQQIPGSLTGLGILGTFVGLIIGISEIGFSSVEAALTSVQALLNGINTAFYTSIAGVILSILFNILQKMTWNTTMRELDLFTDAFHKEVIPTVGEQERYQSQKQMQLILERLDRIPKGQGFSISSHQDNASFNLTKRNEKILMPQVADGLKNGEFIFVLQPKYDINTRKIISAEAYVRWNHPKLGLVSPAVFLPMIEENGYILKLDKYIWESVFRTIKSWSDTGIQTLPISINISKTDILAGDVFQTLKDLSQKYDVPPRLIDVEIARNAFIDAPELTAETTKQLRRAGFKVILDGFDGDFVPLNSSSEFYIDELKLDLRKTDTSEQRKYTLDIAEQAKQISCSVSVEGIESMEQVSNLRKCGYTTGQGYYFSKPVQQEEYLEMLSS